MKRRKCVSNKNKNFPVEEVSNESSLFKTSEVSVYDGNNCQPVTTVSDDKGRRGRFSGNNSAPAFSDKSIPEVTCPS